MTIDELKALHERSLTDCGALDGFLDRLEDLAPEILALVEAVQKYSDCEYLGEESEIMVSALESFNAKLAQL